MSSKNKLIYITLITVVFCIFIAFGLGDFRSRQMGINLLGERVFAAVSQAEQIVDSEQIKNIIESKNTAGSYYHELRKNLMDIQQRSDIKDVYIMTKDKTKGKWYFVVDGMPADHTYHSPFGTELDDFPIGLEKAIRGKTIMDEYYRNSRGTLVSSFIGIEDADGNAIAVVGGDIDASEVMDSLYLTKYIQIGVFASGLLIIGIAAWVLLRRRIA